MKGVWRASVPGCSGMGALCGRRRGGATDARARGATAAAMNEMTWATVQQWERLHQECDDPRLSRFIGRPHDLSPLGTFPPLSLSLTGGGCGTCVQCC